MRQRAHTLTTRCCTLREIGPVDVEDEANLCAMEATDEIKEEGTEVMPTAIPDPPEIGGVEAMITSGMLVLWQESAPIWKEPDPDPVPDKPTMEIGSDRTTLKDPEKPEKGQPA